MVVESYGSLPYGEGVYGGALHGSAPIARGMVSRYPRSRAWRGNDIKAVTAVMADEFYGISQRLLSAYDLEYQLFGVVGEKLAETEALLLLPSVGTTEERKDRVRALWTADRQSVFDQYGSLSPRALQEELRLMGFAGLYVSRAVDFGTKKNASWGFRSFGSFSFAPPSFQVGLPALYELIMNSSEPYGDLAIEPQVLASPVIMERSYFVGGSQLSVRPQVPQEYQALVRSVILRNKPLGVPVFTMIDFI